MLYDDQAESFDDRAGLPPNVVADIIPAITQHAPQRTPLHCLELGPGTGEIGIHLAQQPHWIYTALDAAQPMLDTFQKRAPLPDTAHLHHADINDPWPLPDQSTDLIFTARAIHHFNPEHLLTELGRIADPTGATLLIGTLHRDPDSPKSRLRHEMRRLLQAAGHQGRSANDQQQALLETACQRGAEMIQSKTIAQWTVEAPPISSIENWRNKSGLAGLTLSKDVKQKILDKLTQWAAAQWEDPSAPQINQESYALAGLHIPPA